MRAAFIADNLFSSHAVTCVDHRAYSISREWQPEARPSRSGVFVIDVLSRERSLSAFVLGHFELRVGKFGT
jgi:hypothetical protein